MSKKGQRVSTSNGNSSDSSDDANLSWIQWFCGLKGNEIFCEVEEDFIQDDFNLTGLRSIVQNYDYAIDLILDSEADDLTEEQQEIVEISAELLYGLIHARFVLTPRGMSLMLEKYRKAIFGRCPRVLCEGEPVLPCGQSDQPKMNTVKFFCSRCQELYHPKLKKHANIDGAYFGTTFCHLFFQCYPQLSSTKAKLKYTPRIYGFKIHPTARERQEEELRLHRERQQKFIQSNQQTSSPNTPNKTRIANNNQVPGTPL